MIGKLNTVKKIYRRHGLLALFLYTVRILFYRRKSGGRIFLYVLDTPKPSAASVKAAEGHLFRFATRDDLERLGKDPTWDIKPCDIKAHERGDQCLLQYDGEKLAGYTWMTSDLLVEVSWGFHFNMPDGTVYNYKGFTTPEYRGKGFQPLRNLKIFEHIKQQGKKRLFAYIDHLNLSSQYGVRKSGYKKVGVLSCKTAGGKFKCSLKVDANAWSLKRRN